VGRPGVSRLNMLVYESQ